ncbi:MAG: carbohydrate ABC transporter permease [Anaerolineaceae bacterium]|nr:carbohydrate ABC transporter permease [Anaerolineaceae bacterium]
MSIPFEKKQPINWNRRFKSILGNVVTYALVLILIAVILGPFIWMIISSISPARELAEVPPHWIPEEPTLSRYKALFFGAETGQNVPIAVNKFIEALRNSLIITSVTTLSVVVTATCASYAFVRLPVPGRRGLMFGFLAAQMLPIVVTVIPLYMVMNTLDLIDTWKGMIILYTGFMLPTAVWIMHSYFQTLPFDLEEAAMIDGCTRFQAFLNVVLPISGPGIVAISAFAFLYTWNEFFMALVFTQSQAKTIPVIITEFTTQSGMDYGLMATGGVIGSLPPIILAFLLQKYIVAGLTSGAVKG